MSPTRKCHATVRVRPARSTRRRGTRKNCSRSPAKRRWGQTATIPQQHTLHTPFDEVEIGRFRAPRGVAVCFELADLRVLGAKQRAASRRIHHVRPRPRLDDQLLDDATRDVVVHGQTGCNVQELQSFVVRAVRRVANKALTIKQILAAQLVRHCHAGRGFGDAVTQPIVGQQHRKIAWANCRRRLGKCAHSGEQAHAAEQQAPESHR